MPMSRCGRRAVKEAFVLANRMKDGPFTVDGFVEQLCRHAEWVESLDAETLDSFVTDEHRLRRYNEGTWTLRQVDLDRCTVWPTMGGRAWAKGPVDKVTELLRRHGNRSDRIWQMAEHVNLFRATLPLVVIASKRDATKLRIDDGCLGAVACYLAGVHQAIALVGKVPDNINHAWPWTG
jgi:hypothetical protein